MKSIADTKDLSRERVHNPVIICVGGKVMFRCIYDHVLIKQAITNNHTCL